MDDEVITVYQDGVPVSWASKWQLEAWRLFQEEHNSRVGEILWGIKEQDEDDQLIK